jgi:hypothetical protein
MADLGDLQLTRNNLTGPVPNLVPFESLGTLDIRDNKFTGPLSPFRGQFDNFCWVGGQRGDACYEYDPEWSEPTCTWYSSNRNLSFCPLAMPQDDVVPQTDWFCFVEPCEQSMLVRRVWSFQQGVTMQCKGNRGLAADYGNDHKACQFYSDDKCTTPVAERSSPSGESS